MRKVAITVLLVAGIPCLGWVKEKPNIILFLADDMGVTDMGAFHELYPGAPEAQLAHRYTPTLDRLAKEGIGCTRAYSAAWCAPSRQMLLSGQWVNRRNAYDHPWIGSQLRQEGYVTCLVGKSHGSRRIAKAYRNMDPETAELDDGFFFNGGCRRSYLKKGETFPGRRGLVPFTFTAKGGEYLTDVYTDHAVEFIENHADRPFMLHLPYNAPHGPLDGKPEDLRKLFPEVFGDGGAVMTGSNCLSSNESCGVTVLVRAYRLIITAEAGDGSPDAQGSHRFRPAQCKNAWRGLDRDGTLVI